MYETKNAAEASTTRRAPATAAPLERPRLIASAIALLTSAAVLVWAALL